VVVARCGFKTDIKYRDENTGEYVQYVCREPEENNSGQCIFHDENYLKDPKNKAAKQNVANRLTEKIKTSEPLICIGYHLIDFSFKQLRFRESVDFSDTVFYGPVDFSESIFGHAAFTFAQFTEKADFSGAKFKRAGFSFTQFKKEADFSGAQFENANFSHAKFTQEVNFMGSNFTKDAAFFETVFMVTANFSFTSFTEKAEFARAKFTLADFSAVKFENDADFSGSIFATGDFSVAEFTEYADFMSTIFSEKANFTGTQFSKKAAFYEARFAKEADFHNVQFAKEADFHNVQFADQENIRFLTDDLSQVSFVNTDISRVRFGEDTIWGNKFKVRDERDIESQLTADTVPFIRLGTVLAIYRNLRENYEYRLRYDEAGQFFIREMELKRKYEMKSSHPWKNAFRLKWKIRKEIEVNYGVVQRDWISRNFSLIGLYYHLSRYGQSFLRPVLFGAGIVVFSTLLWLTQPNPAGDFAITNSTWPALNNSRNFEIALGRSLTNFYRISPWEQRRTLD
jgi:uncharacterized protein YjbI with pentapeptide repeats